MSKRSKKRRQAKKDRQLKALKAMNADKAVPGKDRSLLTSVFADETSIPMIEWDSMPHVDLAGNSFDEAVLRDAIRVTTQSPHTETLFRPYQEKIADRLVGTGVSVPGRPAMIVNQNMVDFLANVRAFFMDHDVDFHVEAKTPRWRKLAKVRDSDDYVMELNLVCSTSISRLDSLPGGVPPETTFSSQTAMKKKAS